MFGSGGDPEGKGSLDHISASESQLTAEQCAFFDVTGTVQICHHTASTKKPYTIIKTSSEGCISGHSTHAEDYVAVGDPTCQGLGCYPAGAPFDGTVECCDPLWPDASGHCADLCAGVTCGACDPCDHKTGRCAPIAAGTMCNDGVATTINDACDGAGTCAGQPCVGSACIGDGSSTTASAGFFAHLGGVSFTVPAGAPDLTITSTKLTPPTYDTLGRGIVARSPVFEFGPHDTTFSPPLSVSVNVGALAGAIVYWSHDGVDFDQLDANASTGLITFAVDGFSYLVTGTPPCNGKVATASCQVGPVLPCVAAATCVSVSGALTCEALYKVNGTACGAAPSQCQNGPAAVCTGTTPSCPLLGNKTAGTACNDGSLSTYADQCNGSGTCAGTAVVCPATTACTTAYTPNGTNTCTPTYAASGTTCNDGSLSTYADHCNGSGTCAGTAVVCPATTTCTTAWTKNGTNTCTPTYAATTIDLGTLGGTQSMALGVNAGGQVVGYATLAGDAEYHAFSWAQAGGMIDLGTLGGTQSFAYAVNTGGQVVGYSYTAGDAQQHAFSWTQARGMIDLGTLAGTASNAQAVNDLGQVVGYASTAGDVWNHAFSWTQAGGMIDLGTFGGDYAYAYAVNAAGQVVGGASTAGDAESHAFAWTQAGGMIDLGTLGGNYAYAPAVNAVGQVVGLSATAGEAQQHAFSWTQAGGMIDLGTFGGSNSGAEAVNDLGQVVGRALTAGDAEYHAFSWTHAGGMIDLGTLGGMYTEAVAVNAGGQVVGSSNTAGDAAYHAFSWTQAGGMIDLGTLGGAYNFPHAVNSTGQAVGYVTMAGDVEAHAVLWNTSCH